MHSGAHAGWKSLLADETNDNDLDAVIELVMSYLLMKYSSSCASSLSYEDCVHSSISFNSMQVLDMLHIAALSRTALHFAKCGFG